MNEQNQLLVGFLSKPSIASIFFSFFSIIPMFSVIALLSAAGIDILGTNALNVPKLPRTESALLIILYVIVLSAYNISFFHPMAKKLKDALEKNASGARREAAFYLASFTKIKRLYELTYVPVNVIIGSSMSTLRIYLSGITDLFLLTNFFLKSTAYTSIVFAITFVMADYLVTRTYLGEIEELRQVMLSNLDLWHSTLSVWSKLVIVGFANVYGFAVLLSYEHLQKGSHTPVKIIAISGFISLAYLSFYLYYRSNSRKFNKLIEGLLEMVLMEKVDLSKQLPIVSTDDLVTLTILHEALMQRISAMVSEIKKASEIVTESTRQFQISYEELRQMTMEVSNSVNDLTKNTQEISTLISRTQEVVNLLQRKLREMERDEMNLTQKMLEATRMIRILTFNVTLEASRLQSSESGGFLAITKQIGEFSENIASIYQQFLKTSTLFKQQVLSTMNELVNASEVINTDTSNIASQTEEISAMAEEAVSGIEELENRLNELVQLANGLNQLTKGYA